MFKNALLTSLACTGLVLSGCGGGGGSDNSSSGTTTTPITFQLSFKTNLPSQIAARTGDNINLVLEVQTSPSTLTDVEWYFNGAILNVPNAGTLFLPNVTEANQGEYYAIVRQRSNPSNFITSNKTKLTIEKPLTKPSFAQGATDFRVVVGDTVTLDPKTIGSPTLSYQWYKNDKPMTGQTGATLKLSNAQKNDAGMYYVIAKNDLGQTKSGNYNVGVEIQLATGVWTGTLDGLDTIFLVAPDGQFTLDAFSATKGSLKATGKVRTTSLVSQSSEIRFDPKSEVYALALDANSNIANDETKISFRSGLYFTPNSVIDSPFFQIITTKKISPTFNFPDAKSTSISLNYDALSSSLVTTPQDLSGLWKTVNKSNNTTVHQVSIDTAGKLTGTLFEGNCEISQGTVKQATDSTALYTVEYTLIQPAGKNCPIAAYNPVYKGLALRVPASATTSGVSLYVSSFYQYDTDNKIGSAISLFLSR